LSRRETSLLEENGYQNFSTLGVGGSGKRSLPMGPTDNE
jgi:hypothetical protein